MGAYSAFSVVDFADVQVSYGELRENRLPVGLADKPVGISGFYRIGLGGVNVGFLIIREVFTFLKRDDIGVFLKNE